MMFRLPAGNGTFELLPLFTSEVYVATPEPFKVTGPPSGASSR